MSQTKLLEVLVLGPDANKLYKLPLFKYLHDYGSCTIKLLFDECLWTPSILSMEVKYGELPIKHNYFI